MKKLIVIATVLYCTFAGAQTLPNFDLIKLEKAPDFKAAEPYALQTANFLLSNPYITNDKDKNRMNALRFIGTWMNGTPDYSFALGNLEEVVGKDSNLIGLYMVAKAKYMLENRATAKDQKLVHLNAITILLNYCESKSNQVKMTKQLKKLSEAKEKGELEKLLQGS